MCDSGNAGVYQQLHGMKAALSGHGLQAGTTLQWPLYTSAQSEPVIKQPLSKCWRQNISLPSWLNIQFLCFNGHHALRT